uniref:Mitochondrial import inner membrane translocase subunit Tim21 n=1 Tax=Hyaloperonospora arabidopsidis (strain Emoy2) TaxID=559515 RepID=M4B4R7_HYAAE
MSSSWLFRHCARPLTAARVLPISASPPLSRELCSPFGYRKSAFLVWPSPLKRFYSFGSKNPWQNDKHDWTATLKKGGLVLLGTGALLASTSLAFGLIIAGAAGIGAYTLYHKVLRLYRSHTRSSSTRDSFSSVSSNIDALNDMFRRSRRRGKKGSAPDDQLSSMVQGLPLVMRGFVKMVFSLVGNAMQSSLERASELQRWTNEHLQANQRVRDQMGDDVSVGEPEQWMESTVNGDGHIEAVFPVNAAYSSARVTMKASIGSGGDLKFTKLTYHNRQTGDTIDLLRDSSAGGRRKTVIDADVDVCVFRQLQMVFS